MLTATELKSALGQFHGTEAYHRLSPFHFGMVCTDGVKFLADNGGGQGAYWLIDVIGSYQPQLKKEDFQSWKFTKDPAGDGAVVTCTDGNKTVLVEQVLEFTDLQVDVQFFVENQVCMLPSER